MTYSGIKPRSHSVAISAHNIIPPYEFAPKRNHIIIE